VRPRASENRIKLRERGGEQGETFKALHNDG
jgi:hypothetical protein